MAENDVRSKEYRELPEHTSHAEYGPLNPDISCFRESAVTANEENIFQGSVPPGEEENPYTAARRKKKDKKRYALLSKFLAGAVRAGAAAFGLLLLIGLIILLNKDSSDTDSAIQAKEILEAAQRPVQSVPDGYGPDEIGGVWAGDPAAPHKYDMEHPIIVKEAGCTEQGEIHFICSECGVILSEELAAHGHSPAEKVTENEVASSCLEQGMADEVVYCSVCGEELSREKVARALGPHTPKDPVEENRVEATCTMDGSYDTVVYCGICQEEISRETAVLEAPGHTENEAVVENASDPTCTEEGGFDTVTYCSVCGEEVSRVTTIIEALGHTEGEAVEENRTEATCTKEGGFDSVIYCSVCGEELSRERTVIEATGHNYTASVTAATCTARGYTTHTCGRCGNSYTDSYTAALGHSYIARTTAASCTAQGYTTHTCSRCQTSYKDNYTAALGHNMGSWTTAKAATCTAAGTDRRTCSRCGYAETRSTAALGHNYVLSTGKCSRCSRNAIQISWRSTDSSGTRLNYTIDSTYKNLFSSSGYTVDVAVGLYHPDDSIISDYLLEDPSAASGVVYSGNLFSGEQCYVQFRIYNAGTGYYISTNTVTVP